MARFLLFCAAALVASGCTGAKAPCHADRECETCEVCQDGSCVAAPSCGGSTGTTTTSGSGSTGGTTSGPVLTSPKVPLSVVGGGGAAASAHYRLQLSVGSPQPYGTARSANHQVVFGPH